MHFKKLLLFYYFVLINKKLVKSSGSFELQFLDGFQNLTKINICLKEFWNSGFNQNKCTFGERDLVLSSFGQNLVKIPFTFRWIVSLF
jgi:hypothetical protein